MFIRDAQSFGRLEAGSRVEFNNSRPPPTWTSVVQFFSILHDVCGLEKLGLVDKNRLERDLSALLLKTLDVGKRQQSYSIEVTLSI